MADISVRKQIFIGVSIGVAIFAITELPSKFFNWIERKSDSELIASSIKVFRVDPKNQSTCEELGDYRKIFDDGTSVGIKSTDREKSLDLIIKNPDGKETDISVGIEPLALTDLNIKISVESLEDITECDARIQLSKIR